MGQQDGRREAVAYLEHSKRSLGYETVGPLRLLVLLRVPFYLLDLALLLLSSFCFAWLLPGVRNLLYLLNLSPADMVHLPGALEGVQELIQAYVALHELLQQLL